ncbi:polysaccharide biosynthesis protein [Defluviitalea saccharophila]|uniref:Polysaccharide biosynthesis protein n=1 Tax=Defluviitalea saccharophila TaxID=879970 RepID=A0ABZ2Y417_9FIRM
MTKKNAGGALVRQAAILAVASLIVRVIGLIYRWPLTNMIGDDGNGLYGIAFNIYLLFFIISSSGLPASISKMVSERMALKQYKSAHKVFKISLLMASITGVIASLILWFGAYPIAQFMDNTRIVYSMKALAPTLLIVAIMSAFRGYYQGMNTMVPTAISQIIEQVFNAVFSIVLAGVLLKYGVEYGAAGGTMGTGIGALMGLLFLIFIYILARPRIKKRINRQKEEDFEESSASILKTLLVTSIPIIIGSTIFSFTNLVDVKMVMSILQSIGMTEIEANELYGQLSGKYVTLTNLPISISTALATAIVPSIAASVVLKETKVVMNKVNLAMRVAMMLAAPSAVGLFVLGDPILKMLFPKYPAGGDLLRLGALAVIFQSLVQVATAILQGVGKPNIPAYNAGVGVLIKIVLNFFLIAIPAVNIKGAIISTIVCYIVIAYLDMKAAIRLTKVKLQVFNTFVKPLGAGVGMGVFSFIFYKLILWGTTNNTVSTIGSILLSVIVYIGILFAIGGISKEEILLLPKGEKIASKLIHLSIIRE